MHQILRTGMLTASLGFPNPIYIHAALNASQLSEPGWGDGVTVHHASVPSQTTGGWLNVSPPKCERCVVYCIVFVCIYANHGSTGLWVTQKTQPIAYVKTPYDSCTSPMIFNIHLMDHVDEVNDWTNHYDISGANIDTVGVYRSRHNVWPVFHTRLRVLHVTDDNDDDASSWSNPTAGLGVT